MVADPANNVAGSINPDRSLVITDVNASDGATVDGLHNSMIDVLACLRCYLKMRHNYNDTTILS